MTGVNWATALVVSKFSINQLVDSLSARGPNTVRLSPWQARKTEASSTVVEGPEDVAVADLVIVDRGMVEDVV